MNYLFLAEGFEIVEAMAPADMLARAGVLLKTVSITSDCLVHSSHGIGVEADMNWSEFSDTVAKEGLSDQDFLIFPGGMPGSVNLSEKDALVDLLRRHFSRGGNVAAICAAPSVVLGKLGTAIEGRNICCYAGFEDALAALGAKVGMDDGVVIDRNMVTSRGAGHAIAFGLAIVSVLCGQARADQVAKSIML